MNNFFRNENIIYKKLLLNEIEFEFLFRISFSNLYINIIFNKNIKYYI